MKNTWLFRVQSGLPLGTKKALSKALLKMIFLFPKSDMLVPCRVYYPVLWWWNKINHYQDPYWTTSILECDKDFFRGSVGCTDLWPFLALNTTRVAQFSSTKFQRLGWDCFTGKCVWTLDFILGRWKIWKIKWRGGGESRVLKSDFDVVVVVVVVVVDDVVFSYQSGFFRDVCCWQNQSE